MKPISRLQQSTLFALSTLAVLAPLAATSPALAVAGDGDNDGVADALDVAPCNASVTNVVAFPAENQYATLAFEDQWPSIGDYDFNDLVLPYNVEIYRNAAGNASRVRYVFAPKAMGAAFDNGLAVHLPVGTAGATAQVKLGNGSFTSVPLESGESEVVVRVAENVRATFFGGAVGTVNTDEGKASVTPTTAELVIDFATPVALNTANAPFDVFIFRSGDFAHQIHTSGFGGTSKMRSSLFGTLDDASDAGRKFVDFRGVPFVLNLPVNAAFPQENRRVDALFPRIVDFAASNGAQFSNFHSVNVNTAASFRNALAATPAIPTAAIREQSCIATVGSSASFAGASCKAIKDQGGSVGDGLYFIDPDGAGSGFSPMQVRCDMTTDGGGWAMIVNSSRFEIQGGSASNYSFWRIPFASRFNTFGTPELIKDYYNGALYIAGNSTGNIRIRDDIVDLNGKLVIAMIATATSFDTNLNPVGRAFVSGDTNIFNHQFSTYGTFDGGGATGCSNAYSGVAQHYGGCWIYNFASDAEPGQSGYDNTSHPHLNSGIASSLGLTNDGTGYTTVNRITRWVRW